VDESSGADRSQATTEETPAARSEARFGRTRSKTFLPEVTDVDFPMGRRGYDRAAVDEYVERVSRIVVELESNRSPDAVIERALADVGEETSAILRRARAAAEEIVGQARADAAEQAARAEAEARRTREEAEGYGAQAKIAAENIIAEAKAKVESRAASAEAEARQIRGEADRYREQAKVEADDIVSQANEAAQQLMDRAAQEADKTRTDAEREREEVKAQVALLTQERHGSIDQLRALADDLHRAADRALEPASEPEPTDSASRPADGSSDRSD
jgi:DivIVA domain-containing protein